MNPAFESERRGAIGLGEKLYPVAKIAIVANFPQEEWFFATSQLLRRLGSSRVISTSGPLTAEVANKQSRRMYSLPDRRTLVLCQAKKSVVGHDRRFREQFHGTAYPSAAEPVEMWQFGQVGQEETSRALDIASFGAHRPAFGHNLLDFFGKRRVIRRQRRDE